MNVLNFWQSTGESNFDPQGTLDPLFPGTGIFRIDRQNSYGVVVDIVNEKKK